MPCPWRSAAANATRPIRRPHSSGSRPLASQRPRTEPRALAGSKGCSERWFVVELAPLRGAFAVAAAIGPLRLGDRPPQGWGDLVGVDLGHRALLPLGSLPRARPKMTKHHGTVALGQGLGTGTQYGSRRVETAAI